MDGGCQELINELKNAKTDLGGGSYGQNGVGSGLISGGAGCPGVAGRGAGARWFQVRAPGVLRDGRKNWGKSKIPRISWCEGWGLLGRG